MNSHWQTPVSDKKYKDNYDSIFKNNKAKSHKNTEHGQQVGKENTTNGSSKTTSKGIK